MTGEDSTHEVTVSEGGALPTAVVAATTTWREFPSLWKELLDEVWACLRAGGITHGCARYSGSSASRGSVSVRRMLSGMFQYGLKTTYVIWSLKRGVGVSALPTITRIASAGRSPSITWS